MTLKPKKHHIEQHFGLQYHLPMWTIYRPTTKDYPGMWVGRMFLTLPESSATDLLITGSTLEEVRQQLPPGLVNLGRDDEDDPVIEEVWL